MKNQQITTLVVNELYYQYKEKIIFEHANIEIKFNTLYLHGVNGSGKSTFLNLIFKQSKKYKITFDDQCLKENDIAYIEQELNLFDELTVKENLKVLKFNQKEKLEYIFENKLENKKLGLLSGGERQIVNICIGLASYGKILLIDEPFNNLSLKNQNKIEKMISEDIRPKIIVTHKQMDIPGKILKVEKRKLRYE